MRVIIHPARKRISAKGQNDFGDGKLDLTNAGDPLDKRPSEGSDIAEVIGFSS
jgi:hypothetical protein